ncbi:hypothetical protein PR048_011908 [Dryococelus australis]|uniref:Uncharacterized protein n=1 Tax=Dryococelus australis TaxID=614101 RepID=A0ABQ9HN48_9NEOP|nr:hypothetical protein PR048_011908 [Dryococelus australis]
MSKLHCCGRNIIQLFQKGIIVFIKSLQLLYRDLNHTQDISYILTHRHALYHLRMMILDKNQDMLRTKTNTTAASDDSEFVASKVLKVNVKLKKQRQQLISLEKKCKPIGNVTVADNIIAQTEFTFLLTKKKMLLNTFVVGWQENSNQCFLAYKITTKQTLLGSPHHHGLITSPMGDYVSHLKYGYVKQNSLSVNSNTSW